MTLQHEPDVRRADWFATRDEPWWRLVTLGPSGFAAYARLFASTARDVPAGDTDQASRYEGDLPDDDLALLTTVLARHTSTPDDCLFALWDGSGEIDGGVVLTTGGLFGRRRSSAPEPAFPPHVMTGPRLRIPNRDYLLFSGPLAEAGQWGAADLFGSPRRINSPHLIWPQDRAWFVATEVDSPWTGVGGSAELVAELLAAPGLDAEPVPFTDEPPYWR